MNLRQAVALCVLVGGPKMLTFEPAYFMEKVECCEMSPIPETILDETNRDIFNQYAEYWGKDWDTQRDLNRPMAEVLASELGYIRYCDRCGSDGHFMYECPHEEKRGIGE